MEALSAYSTVHLPRAPHVEPTLESSKDSTKEIANFTKSTMTFKVGNLTVPSRELTNISHLEERKLILKSVLGVGM